MKYKVSNHYCKALAISRIMNYTLRSAKYLCWFPTIHWLMMITKKHKTIEITTRSHCRSRSPVPSLIFHSPWSPIEYTVHCYLCEWVSNQHPKQNELENFLCFLWVSIMTEFWAFRWTAAFALPVRSNAASLNALLERQSFWRLESRFVLNMKVLWHTKYTIPWV